MDGSRYVEFLDRLLAAAAEPPFTQGADELAAGVLPVLVRRPWRRLRRAVRGLPAVPADEELHAVRILAKHARYAAEAAARVMGKPAAAFASALAGLQTVLGDHQDACVTEAWLRANLPGAAGPREALLAGELIARQREEAASRRAAWPAAWQRATDPALRAWLG
jgi:CHAD domain-containing protein